MQMRIETAFAVALVACLSFEPFDAHGESPPTALEIARLPKFCYAQYQVPNATGDEFLIQNCGPFANHYCPGLIYLIRAKAMVGNKRGRTDLLARASHDIRGTADATKDYPKCSIREHIAASKAEVLNLQKIYGGASSGAR